MKSGRSFLAIFDHFIDRILCVLGAILFSQGPEFMQQYLQRLGGHLDEARRQYGNLQNAASQSGVTIDELIRQSAMNPITARLADVMRDTIERANSLQAAHDALLSAALWERPFIFLRHLDAGIARATAAVYQPAVPTTAEGLIYALAGMLVFLALYHFGIKRVIAHFRRPPAPVKV